MPLVFIIVTFSGVVSSNLTHTTHTHQQQQPHARTRAHEGCASHTRATRVCVKGAQPSCTLNLAPGVALQKPHTQTPSPQTHTHKKQKNKQTKALNHLIFVFINVFKSATQSIICLWVRPQLMYHILGRNYEDFRSYHY